MLNRFKKKESLVFFALILALGLVHLLAWQPTEPFFYNDETRHVMTGVYFRDLLHDLPVTHLSDYTVNYYLQYPALGLLVWPPFFYFVEGLAMTIFGTSLVVSKILIGVFAAIACAYLFQLVRRTHDTTRAAIAVLIFGLAPLIFLHSSYVMLEVPTLALALAAIYHFIRYLDVERRSHLLLAGLAAALCALTRFDAIYLLPLFIILLVVRGRLRILRRKDVIVVAALALLLVLPFYVLTAQGIGWFHVKQATETLAPNFHFPAFLSLTRYLFYPSYLPQQLSLYALIPAIVGLIFSLTKGRREAAWAYLAMILATYLTFTPIGEMDSRHAIYWIPAFAFFAAEGIALIANWLRTPKLLLPLAALVIISVGWSTVASPKFFVRGYEETARYVATNSTNSPFCLFVGRLNGNFIYQLRRLDPNRRLWVLRADKLLFSTLISSQVEYKQFTGGDEDILATIFKYDPEFLVVEAPQISNSIRVGDQARVDFEERLRAVFTNHPERFKLEKEIAIESNDPEYGGMRLQVFRNSLRNEQPERRLELEILMLRRSLQTDVP
jgi:4-amino-4-deoxy-L-arabinose transferase-like glycosyltransferase